MEGRVRTAVVNVTANLVVGVAAVALADVIVRALAA